MTKHDEKFSNSSSNQGLMFLNAKRLLDNFKSSLVGQHNSNISVDNNAGSYSPPFGGQSGIWNGENSIHHFFNSENYFQQAEGSTKIETETWDGVVDFIDGDRFYVNLVDTKDRYQIPRYQVEFEMSELQKEQRNQLNVGSIVRWETNWKKGSNGKDLPFSELELITLPPISNQKMQSALREAEKLLNGIKSHEEH